MSKQLSDILSRVPQATPRPAKVAEPAPALAVVPPAATAAEASAQPVATSTPQAAKARRGEGAPAAPKPAKAARPAVAEPEQAIQAYVPASVRKAVLLRAVENDTTVRGIILEGLKAIGFDISDEQLRDRRK